MNDDDEFLDQFEPDPRPDTGEQLAFGEPIVQRPAVLIESSQRGLLLRGNPLIQFARETAFQKSKPGKFDYLSAPARSAHSMASEFFTDD